MKLTRKNKEGRIIPETYYSIDHKFEIEKCNSWWNVYELTNFGTYETYRYSFSCDTLKECRESLD